MITPLAKRVGTFMLQSAVPIVQTHPSVDCFFFLLLHISSLFVVPDWSVFLAFYPYINLLRISLVEMNINNNNSVTLETQKKETTG